MYVGAFPISAKSLIICNKKFSLISYEWIGFTRTFYSCEATGILWVTSMLSTEICI